MNDPNINNTPTPSHPTPAALSKHAKIIYALLTGIIVVLAALVIFLWQNKKPEAPNIIIPNPGSHTEATKTPDNLLNQQEQALPENYITAQFNAKWQPLPAEPDDKSNGKERVLAGKVTSGEYNGQNLYIEIVAELGTDYRHYVVINGNTIYFDDKNIKIHGIDDIPAEIGLPNTGYKLKKNWLANVPFNEIKLVKKMFTDPVVGDVYLNDSGCLIVELPNHTAVSYDLVLPFMDESRTLNANINGLENKDSYIYTKITGCGALCMYMAQVDENTLLPFQRLVEVGKTNNGETLYGIKDPQDQALKDLYGDPNTMPYYNDNYSAQPTSKYTYQEFLNYRPLLYWKDPFGRWIEFKNNRFQVAAEMCKPVIYLYPPSPTSLTIRVNPSGGFTYSNPAYGGGWTVTAYPNGKITDNKTGKDYPYLFWEGIGLNYPEQNAGFVVASRDLEKFLTQKLELLGLNKKEATDFKAYWVSRLQGLNKPYLKITFLKKEQFDEIAPLDINPVKPNSVIRVMMTAKGLDSFETLPEQELPTPSARAGFTFVEWGGTVLK